MRTKSKIWLGLSTVAVTGGTLLAAAGTVQALPGAESMEPRSAVHQPAGAPGHHDHSALKIAAAGGEGGEGGEKGTQAAPVTDPAVHLMHNVAMIRGHLLVGDELVRQGRWEDALPHFMHPTEELYPNVKDDLKTFNVRPFESALKALAQTVKAKKEQAYAPALKLLQDQLASAEAAVRATRSDWAPFVVAVALETLRSAGDEYGGAVEEGRVTEAVEYQDSRGFVWEAARLVESVGPQLREKDAGAYASVLADLAELKKAWPSPVPPQSAAKDLSEVLGDVARVELHAGNLL